MPYNGTDNDDYVDGEGFCCDDGTIEAAIAQATHRRTTSRKATPTRTCSSTTIPTTWAAAATSPIWTERWYST